jgi:1-acyl-sn-glycerol-3-phosphate acyltransferase
VEIMTASTMRLSQPLARQTPDRVVVPRYRVIRWVAGFAMHKLFRITIEGLEHWPRGAFVLACNHHNGVDPLVVMAAAPAAPGLTWFGPREDCSSGTARTLVRFLACFIPFTARRGSLRVATASVQAALERGSVVGIFPEGRIAFRETAIQATSPGAAAFAVANRVPVLPCAIVGSSALWPGRSITVSFGAPLVPEGAGEQAVARLRRDLERAIGTLLPKDEPVLDRTPAPWLSDILNGPDDAVRRRRALMGWSDTAQWSTVAATPIAPGVASAQVAA